MVLVGTDTHILQVSIDQFTNITTYISLQIIQSVATVTVSRTITFILWHQIGHKTTKTVRVGAMEITIAEPLLSGAIDATSRKLGVGITSDIFLMLSCISGTFSNTIVFIANM